MADPSPWYAGVTVAGTQARLGLAVFGLVTCSVAPSRGPTAGTHEAEEARGELS